jgi:type I site-specific restriction-modification system R (restriction) subunit
VHLFDFDDPDNNVWVAVNQLTVVEGQNNRRPDILIFINELPIALMELKNPTDENATIWSAFQQIQTYKAQIPSLFTDNELLIISDGMEVRVGSLTADTVRLMPWRTTDPVSTGTRVEVTTGESLVVRSDTAEYMAMVKNGSFTLCLCELSVPGHSPYGSRHDPFYRF